MLIILNHEKKEIAELIKFGMVRQTIKSKKSIILKAGDTICHYENDCKLYQSRCISVESIQITSFGEVIIEGKKTTAFEVYQLAYHNGWRSRSNYSEVIKDFIYFFMRKYGLPFDGQIIRWQVAKQ